MANSYFRFKQFTVHQDRCAMKVTTDACLFGAWAAKQIIHSKPEICNILDIGTGTGLLSLMLAQQINVPIDAVEIDTEAASQAIENVHDSPWKDRIRVIRGDIKTSATSLAEKYKVIISNPPFYENELSSDDSRKNIAHHGSGLLLVELLEIIYRLLDPKGRFYLLLPYKRMIEAGLLFQKYNFTITQTALIRQSMQHDYFRVLVQGKHDNHGSEPYTKTEMSIWNDQQQYTPEFEELLKGYYLYL